MGVRKALFCTLGPTSLNGHVIRELEAIGVTHFRINMSHTRIEDLEPAIRLIQNHTSLPICLDTEGAQLRTGSMKKGTVVIENSRVRLVPQAIVGNASRLSIAPPDAIGRLHPSSRISIDFDSVVLRIDRTNNGSAQATVLTGGEIGSRKAVTALPSPGLPAFTEKDLAAIRISLLDDIHWFALSFCETPASVHQLREMVGPNCRIIAKIESRKGVRNLVRIAEATDGLLIDRGDLSREVRLEAIPLLQKAMIRKANALGTPVYVATNLLESMVTRRTPTRAEVNDVMNTLIDGADGLVLAAETAIGKYPVEAAKMIASLLKEYETSIEGYHIDELLGDHPLALDHTQRAPTSKL